MNEDMVEGRQGRRKRVVIVLGAGGVPRWRGRAGGSDKRDLTDERRTKTDRATATSLTLASCCTPSAGSGISCYIPAGVRILDDGWVTSLEISQRARSRITSRKRKYSREQSAGHLLRSQ